jgi:hypothetical protein
MLSKTYSLSPSSKSLNRLRACRSAGDLRSNRSHRQLHSPPVVERLGSFSFQIQPEAHFVTLCVREPDTVEPLEILRNASTVQDWDGLVVTAVRHGVAAFVQQAVASEQVTIPERVDGALRAAVLFSVARTMRLNAVLATALAALGAAKVPVIVLKGPTLERTIYSARKLRPYGDIDITVRDRDSAAAADILLESGFTEVPYEAEAARQCHPGHDLGGAFHRIFVTRDRQAVVELHTDPLQLGLKPTCEAARWERAIPMPGLPDALMLCPEDQVVQLSVHVHKHGFNRLIWLKDLDLLLRAYQHQLDWDLVTSVARQEGVQASVWYTLYLTRMLLATPIPAGLLERLQPALPLRALYSQVWPARRIANLNMQMRRRAVQFHLAESWRGTLPSLLLMGRRLDRARSIVQTIFR